MATHEAIAAVSRTLRTMLLDRMVLPAAVTLAPPDVTVTGIDGARVNLYLMHVLENAGLKNQEIPGNLSVGAYGRPRLSLNLRYLLTTHSMLETQPDADLNAQTLLGDAMRVLHDFGNQVDSLAITKPAAGAVGDPILDPVLTNEYERVKLTLHPAMMDEITRIWSALSEANFRRSVIYEITVVQITTTIRETRPRPVDRRRIIVSTRRPPVIESAYVTPPPGSPPGELRVRIGDEITIEAELVRADKVFVRLGSLDPIRVPAPPGGIIKIVVPDDQYPVDLDHPATRPIPTLQLLQPGPLEIQMLVEQPADAVQGALDRGTSITLPRRYASNVTLLQLVPKISSILPTSGAASTVLKVSGTRLWHVRARAAEVIIADAAVRIRAPGAGDPWAAPTPSVVEIPVADAAASLPVLSSGDPPYPVAVEIDGARSRDAFGFLLGP
jgi:hypothetical protein